jgi:hypothetical protein
MIDSPQETFNNTANIFLVLDQKNMISLILDHFSKLNLIAMNHKSFKYPQVKEHTHTGAQYPCLCLQIPS